MKSRFENLIKNQFEAYSVHKVEVIQKLWSNYGEISRWKLEVPEEKIIIVKEISGLEQESHPRGWNTGISHQRKMWSYQVEMNWYKKFASKCSQSCRVPDCYHIVRDGEKQLLILEDLDKEGYSLRRKELSYKEIKLCLSWLACFHATFLEVKPDDLWETGTYWHLATRPDEWQRMQTGWLKNHAVEVDKILSEAQFQTIVHGDAKVANFCFSKEMKKVAAVDFQYVGGGCGMKDVAYLMSSCLTSNQCFQYENQLLDFYFMELEQFLKKVKKCRFFTTLEQEWRKLYPYAWADFVRFLKGWAPEHQKLNAYSKEMVNRIK